jgi:hypothetical protein
MSAPFPSLPLPIFERTHLLKTLLGMDPHLDETEPAQPLWISEHVEEEAFWLDGAGRPHRAVGGFPFFDVLGVDGEGYEEGELFGHGWWRIR